MAKRQASVKVRATGAYKVKAAESRSTRVRAKTASGVRQPSRGDKQLAKRFLKQRSS